MNGWMVPWLLAAVTVITASGRAAGDSTGSTRSAPIRDPFTFHRPTDTRSAASFQKAPGPPAGVPELPRVFIDTTYARPSGRTIPVNAGGNFQAALSSAQPGDTIVLQAGATFTGPFNLPRKGEGGWIYIQSSAYQLLPPPGARVAPSDATNMAKLVTPSGPYLISLAQGAHHYRFVGIEMTPSPNVFLGAILNLGLGGERSVGDLAHHFVIDRCYIHGDPTVGSNKGVAMNAASVAIVDSHISDLKSTGNPDTNAVWVYNSPGPIKLLNTYLEGAGENVMIGGAVPTIADLIPSDIEIRRNHIAKSPRWRGSGWKVKNLLEMKSGNRVLIEGNVLEYSWADAQAGYAFMLTPRVDTGNWTTVSDITIRNNVIRHVGSALGASGFEGPPMLHHSKNVLIQNNVWSDVGTPGWGDGILFMISNGIANVTIENNTAVHTGHIILVDSGSEIMPGFAYRNNIQPHNAYGVYGGGVGSSALKRFFPAAVFEKNVIAGPWPTPGGATPSNYSGHPSNFFPNGLDTVKFVDRPRGNYRLASSSPYRRAGTDGKDIGANIDAIEAATAGVAMSPPR